MRRDEHGIQSLSDFVAPGQLDAGEETVVPSALVDCDGRITELNDGRGRRHLEAHPELLIYASGLLACELRSAAFVWIDAVGIWNNVRIQRVPRAAEANPEVSIEILEIAAPCGLTPRELDVLTLIGGGLSNPEIAAQLEVSSRTVMTHVERVLAKLGQASRSGAAAMSVELGMLRLPVPGGNHHLGGLAVAQLDAFARRGAIPARPRTHAATRPRPYLIGSALPLSGLAACDGLEFYNGARLAISEINARGGIAGRPVEQVIVDVDVLTEHGLQQALTRLVEAEVDAITVGYSHTVKAEDLAEVGDYGCPVLSSMTFEEMTAWVQADRGHLSQIFQVGPTEINYGRGCVRFLEQIFAAGQWTPPNRRIMFAETAIAGGRVTDAATIDAVERAGWSIDSLVQTCTLGGEPQLIIDQIHRSQPAVAVIGLYIPAQMAAFQRGFAEHPTDTLVYGIYAPSVPEYRELAGAAAEGVVWATVCGRYSDVIGKRFESHYKDAFDVMPGRSLAGISYDQVGMLARAWAGVGNPRAFTRVGDELRRATYRGVNGTYTLGLDGRQCGIGYPDETPDPSVGQAHLVFQVQNGEHRILHPTPYAEAEFRLPPWFSGR